MPRTCLAQSSRGQPKADCWRLPRKSRNRDISSSSSLSSLAPFGFFASYLGRRLANSAILSMCVTVMLRAISVIQMGFSVDNYMLDPAQVRQCDDFVAPANEPPTSFSESPPTLR